MTTDWPKTGDKVAVCDTGRLGTSMRVTVTTVARLTATQIVLDNHPTRFRRDNLREVGAHYGGVLLPLDDNRVIQARARARFNTARADIDAVFHGVPLSASPSDLRALLAKVVGLAQRADGHIRSLYSDET